MRTRAELSFRLRQEIANVGHLAAPPRLRAATVPAMAPLLPDPAPVFALLRGTAYAAECHRLAGEIRAHRFPLFGSVLDTGPQIAWNRDYGNGIEYPAVWFRRIPYLDFSRVGDHKIIWELNRHQQLVLLAQAWRLTGQVQYLNEIGTQLESWMDANPYGRGMQWTSALEVAFRALSWVWTWHLAAAALAEPLRLRWAEALYQHGVYLRRNLSVYFSPNTHLLGEAVALHALGRLFPTLPGAAEWRATGGRIVVEEMERQVRADGSHFEQSSYYHVYAVDFFLFYALLENTPDTYRARLRRMAEYLWALLGPAGRIPFLGDDDGGRLFHPYGDRATFGRATLAACARFLKCDDWPCLPDDLTDIAVWWLGDGVLTAPDDGVTQWQPATGTLCFPDAGVVSLLRGSRQVLMDTRGFGAAGAGHSHASALSLICRDGAQEILIDPGTYTYITDPAERDRFRGTRAHNTVFLNGRDQATPAGPFRWNAKPVTELHGWGEDWVDASCVQHGARHRRRLEWAGDVVTVSDQAEGEGEAAWHTALPVRELGPGRFALGEAAILEVPGGRAEASWHSPAHGSKQPATAIRAPLQGGALETRILFRQSFSQNTHTENLT
ncbi:MAG: alginate lyase family protein [Bryobacterales bacterium]|nr:alginate lyase family protein [Bryobacterales bacterium]